ncbi:S8 family serine peptidase [Tautonia sociabilis]|uniref:DUF4214 domain-containing protein n=1 Tax=Tautonia sociabilis TaxID=2080755 RepID=A0A432MEL9_9BACT|nr:S8 family serine peptidase [Tautonia sociabilis]RUL83963.1 DUF4214 domain-containing protein [Tautonia sociabilis]
MPRKAHRARCAPIVEAFESRTLLSTLASPPGSEDVPIPAADVEASRGLLVRPIDGVASGLVQRFYRALGATVQRSYPDGPTLLQLPSQRARDAAVSLLASRPWVEYAEPDGPLIQADGGRVVPNDPSFGQLWGLDNASDLDINAPEAWAAAGGGQGVLVAVLDTGIDLTHPDLAGRIWTNPGEIPGNGIDDDRNGYIDDVNGWNFVSRTSDVRDDNGHGTHVSGTIAAVAGNGIGVTGVAFGATVMPLKVLGADGSGSISKAVDAIYYAAAHGARVINASWGGPGYSKSLDDAIRAVGQANPSTGALGTVFVSAAGNEAVDNDVRPSYPPNNRYASTIAVAAIDQSGRLASYSNYGDRTVDLAAPGDSILSTVPGGYAYYSGTSMAAPHVTGVVALVAAQYPGETAAQLVRRVVGAARPLPSLTGLVASGGLLDAAKAVGSPSVVTSPSSTPTPTPTPTPSPSPSPSPTADPLPVSPRPVAGTADDATVRTYLVSSEEFYLRAGATPERYVDALYRVVLNRPAEPAGLAFWASRLRSGGSRFDVASGIIDSDEARRVMVAGWYRSDLGRTASIEALKYDPGVIFWADRLAAGFRPDEIRAAILGSVEFAARQGGTTDGLIVGVYRSLLDREPNAATRLTASSRLSTGSWNPQTLILSVQTTDEAVRTKVAFWYRALLGRSESVATLKDDSGVAYWAAMLGRG